MIENDIKETTFPLYYGTKFVEYSDLIETKSRARYNPCVVK